jgi:hypothetical protein
MSCTRATALGLVSVLAGFAATAVPAAEPDIRLPLAKVGPYRVVVDRITHNRGVTIDYGPDGKVAGYKPQRTAQLHVAVLTDEPSARSALATFQIKGATVERTGRALEVPYYGGPLENPNDPAIVRAYVYLPGLPGTIEEIRSLEGEIVSYDRTSQTEMEIAVEGPLPRTVEKDGIKLELREWSYEGGSPRLVLVMEAPPGTVIVNTTNDGSYGVSLLNEKGQAAPPASGTMLQLKSNLAEYRTTYQSVQGTPTRIKLQFLHRGGTRRVYPFKVERIPIPTRR